MHPSIQPAQWHGLGLLLIQYPGPSQATHGLLVAGPVCLSLRPAAPSTSAGSQGFFLSARVAISS
jgi:hypothetical protein